MFVAPFTKGMSTVRGRKRYFLAAAVAAIAAIVLPLFGKVSLNIAPPSTNILLGFQNLPLSFEPNLGQADRAASFVAHGSGGTLYFTTSGVALALQASDSTTQGMAQPDDSFLLRNSGSAHRETRDERREVHSSIVQIEFVGALSPSLTSEEPLPGKVSYLKGKDPASWHRDLPTYGRVTYSALYPGVDLTYEGRGGTLKGTYLLAPGADPSLIRWRYSGAENVTLDDNGSLVILLDDSSPSAHREFASSSRVRKLIDSNSALSTLHSAITEAPPVAWQGAGKSRSQISASYVSYSDGTFGFKLEGYDPSQPLAIDPTLTYSTYLGGFYGDGSGSIELDAAGNIYVGGTTSSSDFPIAGNPYQPVYGGGDYDMFVSKISSDGSTLLYSSFIGGDGWDVGGLAGVNPSGIATVGGWTTSEDFPTTPNAYQTFFAGTEDVAVARLSADGTDLIFGSYWGDGGVEEPYGFTIDAAGNTYFTGYYFPGFSSWAFVVALTNDGTQQLLYRTLGGNTPGPGDQNANSSGEGIVVDGAGNIYVTGYTRAADFPTTPGAYRTSIQAFEDGFVTKLAPGGQTILYSTYIPGGVSEYPYDIAIDAAGNAYITGNTSSEDFPITPGAFQSVMGDPRIAFVTKLNPVGSDLVYSTFLGGPEFDFEPETYGVTIRVNSAGNAYVVGYTSSEGFPVANPLQATLNGPYDGFVTKFNPAGSALDFSTYMGGSSGDTVGGIALDGLGNVYLAGSSGSTDFPLVNPLQPTNHGGGDAIIVVIAEEGASTRTPLPTITGTPPTATATPDPCGGLTAWTNEPPMHAAWGNPIGAVLNNEFYVFGGQANTPTPYPLTVEKFNPATNAWSTVAPLPNPVSRGGAATIGSKIYVVDWTTLLVYDSVSNSWSNAAPLPEGRGDPAVAAYGGKLYIIGGQRSDFYPSNTVFEYNPATNTYATKNPMPTAQFEIGGAAVGNKVFVVGGYQYIHYAYDPVADSWSTMATPLTPSFSLPGVFAFDHELWVIGGRDNVSRRGYPPDQEVQIYNTLTNSWRFGPALNNPRYWSTAGGAINGRAYIAGGIDLPSETYPYDYLNSMESISYQGCATPTATACVPQVTSWRVEPPITIGRDYAVGASDGSKLYVIGGSNLDREPPYVEVVERFDPVANAWSTAAPIPIAANWMGVTSIGSKIYVAGGFTVRQGFTLDKMQIYDSATNTWSQGAPMPAPRSSAAVAAHNGKVYVIGGGYQSSTNTVFEYDPATNTYATKAPMPSTQSQIGAATIGNKIYVVGGDEYIHYAYDPVADSWSTIATPLTPSFAWPGVFVLNGELWVEGGYDNVSRHGYPPNQEVQIYNPVTNSWRYGPAFITPRTRSQAVGVVNGRGYVAGGVDLNDEDIELTSVESIAYVPCSTTTPAAATATSTMTRVASATPIHTSVVSTSTATPRPPTQTPGGPTATTEPTGTAVSATSTPIATPTVCTITFSDVPNDHPFYTWIRCLVCRGIISGYSDGTFRPFNEITRGQIAKMVSNAANIHDDPGPQIFEDVDSANPFYTWINRLTNLGHMGGYPCGGEGEPCGSNNWPYFRPFANATRRQLAKIVSNAAGLGGTPIGQFYADVPEDDPFYVWIMRLTELGVMSGYLCGGAGEPCDDQNRPYFRPYNNVTRGQATKFVANTFFPSCQTPSS